MMPYAYLYFVYALVFYVPCVVLKNLSGHYYLSCLVMLTVSLGIHGRGAFRKIKVRSLSMQDYSFVLGVLGLAAIFFLAAGYTGLTNRAELFDSKSNYVTTSADFFKVQIDYIVVTLGVLCLSVGIHGGGRLPLVLGCLVSAYIITSTGTRWLFLLAFSPIIYNFLATKNTYKSLLLFVAGVFLSFYVSMNRDSNVEMDLENALLWDVPSFQSAQIVKSYQPSFSGLLDFVNGNIFILIPRMIWPEKPLDKAVTDYMIGELGFAFDGGATILPGVIGSGWLYGGYAGIVLIGVILGCLMRLSERGSNYDSAGVIYGIIPLIYMGILLQLRGFSVFYFMPAIYLAIFMKARNWLKSRRT